MYKDNYKNIVNIDISDNIIEKMKNTYQDNFENMMCKNDSIYVYSYGDGCNCNDV
jgi:hypothetical protein